jgi:hypothetical protein
MSDQLTNKKLMVVSLLNGREIVGYLRSENDKILAMGKAINIMVGDGGNGVLKVATSVVSFLIDYDPKSGVSEIPIRTSSICFVAPANKMTQQKYQELTSAVIMPDKNLKIVT